MAANVYCVCDVGLLVPQDEESFDFVFRKKRYTNLLHTEFESVLADHTGSADFKFVQTKKDDGRECLSLFVTLNWSLKAKVFESRLLFLSTLFYDVNFDDFVNLRIIENDTIDIKKYITTQLYDLLREAHLGKNSVHNKPIQHQSLNATLRYYQNQAVNWLLMRETQTDTISQDYVELKNRQSSFPNFLVNIRNLSFEHDLPKKFEIRTGGILGDEMGLGKTVEMLALILINPRNIPTTLEQKEFSNRKKRKFNKKRVIFCICGRNIQNDYIECTQCATAQHYRCVQNQNLEVSDPYVCPSCCNEMQIVESGGTIIVSPPHIKFQWHSEIQKHTKGLRVLIYEGLSKKWICSRELAQYDIILVDYNILQKEFYFSNSNTPSISLRGERTYMHIKSPLLGVRWWRVCLDEAQMVENGASNAAKMVKMLPAIHRWAVTGTPINKSIDDLLGLFEYLDIAPLYDRNTWASLVSEFQNGQTQPLIGVLQKFMWRTCKHSISEDLGIPAQSEEIHYIELSDIEKLFYCGQHAASSNLFKEKVDKLQNTVLSEINPQTLKMILEPLRKLRQDCTTPIVCTKNDETKYKQFLQPKELIEHLSARNEKDCKYYLRAMASSYNGIAALHYIKGNYEIAIQYYESVLRLAKDYTGSICVDSLLQIHALFNIIAAHRAKKSIEDLETYLTRLNQLEWKYLDSYISNLRKSEDAFQLANSASKKVLPQISKKRFGSPWISAASLLDAHNEDQIILKVNELKNTLFQTKKNKKRKMEIVSPPLPYRTVQSVIFSIDLWFEKTTEMRSDILEYFKDLNEFTENVKIRETLPLDKETDMQEFISEIFLCHLQDLQMTNKKEKNEDPCILCIIKEKLDLYECLIFDKSRDDDTKIVGGTWNPSFEENALQIMQSHFAKNKNINGDTITKCETSMELINSFKDEFKELRKMWIEIEYTVKAYDEINMCKMRLEAIDPVNEDVDEGKRAVVSIYEIDERLAEYQMELNGAKLEMARKLARLRYLRHLQEATNPGVCPICRHDPENKYCVLECGHHLCMECWRTMVSSAAKKFLCVICREMHSRDTFYFVCRKVAQTEHEVLGDNSAKIEQIIFTVLKLRKKDERVKILIFSQWDSILDVISKALTYNNISNRAKWSANSIVDFKNEDLNITCLLLLLRHGGQGLNLTEATHVFIVEPILNPGEELQAIGRVHRLGQTRPTTVHRFIVKDTIEQNIFDTVTRNKSGNWNYKDLTVEKIKEFFAMPIDSDFRNE